MIMPTPLRVGLLTLLLSASAAAQSDAEFAASLVSGAPTAVQFAKVKAKPQKPAAPAAKAPAAAATVWAKVIETVKRDGKYTPGNAAMPGSFSIEDSSGDAKGDRTMRGISILGRLNDEEQFEAMGAMIVVLEFKVGKDGNTTIDQWMFQTDIYGEVGDAGHATVVNDPAGKILSAVPEKLSPSDPKIQAQYDLMLKHWAERKP